ncbi:hypothetical protein L6452_04447 [Arctium lappa]|uniref:Uncharacterized protein n=1 Tax=Arctium lappa TaxID=4217 RepID=A0ACB9EDI8_ARCLA|nr:hypothetical protein L6452_04447 [Arctium lappa]
MKDKSVVTENPTGSGLSKSSFSSRLIFVREEEEEEEEESERKQTSNDLPLRIITHSGSSRYDFVKVKVWLGDDADHYYVLSRFLLSRMLTVTKIPNHVALKIALELKKLLVDNSLLDVCGLSCIRFTEVSHEMAGVWARVYKPLQDDDKTDMVYELLRTSTDAPLASTPFLARDFSSSEELITEFCRECRIVRKGLAGDLKKAMKDGKPIIIEGMHVDPGIYLIDEERKLPNNVPVKAEETKSSKTLGNDVTWVENDASASSIHDENGHKNAENLKTESNICWRDE